MAKCLILPHRGSAAAKKQGSKLLITRKSRFNTHSQPHPPQTPAAFSKRLYRKCRSTLRLGCTPPGHFRYSSSVFRELSGKDHPTLADIFQDAVVGDGAADHGSRFTRQHNLRGSSSAMLTRLMPVVPLVTAA